MKKINLLLAGIAVTALALCGCSNAAGTQNNSSEGTEDNSRKKVEYIVPQEGESFYATWASSQYQAESSNQPPVALSGASLRQIVHTSVGGNKIRVKFSNLVGNSELGIKEAHIAKTVSGDKIEPATDKIISFNGGNTGCTIGAGKELYSDLLEFSFDNLDCLTVTIYFDTVPSAITGHMGSRTTSYLMAGNHVSDESFTNPSTCEHWYVLAGIDVCAASEIRAVSCLGDSITDGRGSTTNSQNRWTDVLSEKLLSDASTKNVAVINEGIGGTCVTSSGVSRFTRDVLQNCGSYYGVILYGINDIIYLNSSSETIINTYKTLIKKAHNNNVIIYGCTILPFGNCSDYTAAKNEVRLAVNDWIMNTSTEDGGFDGCIDFAALMAASSDSNIMNSEYDSGDGLHPGAAGYKAMGQAVPASLFTKNLEDCKEKWPSSTSSVNVKDTELFKFPLPENIGSEGEAAVYVKGTSNGTKGFRIWLTDDSNSDNSNIYKYTASGSFEITETFTVKTGKTAGYVLFKGISYGTNIEDLTIDVLTVTIDDVKTSISVADDIIITK